MASAAKTPLDSPQALSDVEGMYNDAEFVALKGNAAFFGGSDNLRGFAQLNKEIQGSFVALGLLRQTIALDHARWDFGRFGVKRASAVMCGRSLDCRVQFLDTHPGTLTLSQATWPSALAR